MVISLVEWFSSWAKGIALAVIIATIIEMILPDNNNKKYIKLVIGVYILFVIISPIASAIKGKEIEFNLSDYEKYFENTYHVSSSEIEKNNDNNIEKMYIENIKTDVKQKMKNKGYNVNDISLKIKTDEENYGNIEKMILEIEKTEDSSIGMVNDISVNKVEIGNNMDNKKTISEGDLKNSEIKEIKQYLSDTYSVAKNNIEIN